MKHRLFCVAALAAALVLTACGGAPSSASQAPRDYVQILLDARADDYNEAYPILHGKAGETPTAAHNPLGMGEEEAQSNIDMTLSLLGLDSADCDEYAASVSLMNVKAYGVGIFKPAAGREEAVKTALEGFITAQQKAQENYLPDQYEIAKSAILRKGANGEFILVMSEGAPAIADSSEKALA